MKDKGSIVIHVTLPIKSAKTKGKEIFWKIVDVSSQNNVFFAGPCKKNLLIVTTYDQLSSSNCILEWHPINQSLKPGLYCV